MAPSKSLLVDKFSISQIVLDLFVSFGNHFSKSPNRITFVFSTIGLPPSAIGSLHRLHFKNKLCCKHLLQYVCPQRIVTEPYLKAIENISRASLRLFSEASASAFCKISL
uniref:Uncharacterized protein n=1 Tax=Esox lucius TaxID=8010 RepID=A0A3P9AN42_ESOLU